MKTKRTYYAHSMQIYNTEREKEELSFLRKRFPLLLCPNKDIGNCSIGMEAYLNIVKWSDIVIVSEYLNHIGSGVYSEVIKALRNGISVLCLRKVNNCFCLFQVTGAEVNDKNDYKVLYGKLSVNSESYELS